MGATEGLHHIWMLNRICANGSGGGQKIKAQPNLHKRCKGEGKSYTMSWTKIDKLPNRGIEPTTASIGVRFELGEPVLAIRARAAIPPGYLRKERFKLFTIVIREGLL